MGASEGGYAQLLYDATLDCLAALMNTHFLSAITVQRQYRDFLTESN